MQIGHKLEKWQWRHNFATWRHSQFFWRCFVFLVKFSYWYKFHVNLITGSGITTIFFYKGLTRNAETGNTQFEIFPISGDWRKLVYTNASNKVLLNATKYQGYSPYCLCVIEGKPAWIFITQSLSGKTPPWLGLIVKRCCVYWGCNFHVSFNNSGNRYTKSFLWYILLSYNRLLVLLPRLFLVSGFTDELIICQVCIWFN